MNRPGIFASRQPAEHLQTIRLGISTMDQAPCKTTTIQIDYFLWPEAPRHHYRNCPSATSSHRHDRAGRALRSDIHYFNNPKRSRLQCIRHFLSAFKSNLYPYGLDHTAPTFLGFTGQPTDPVTGCYPLGNGHRFYNPAMMRFHQPDRLSPFHRGATNSYTYALGDPVNLHDPSGQLPQFIVTGVSRTVRLIKRVLREAINQALAPPAIVKDYLQPILSTIVATAENASRQLLPAATPLPLRLAVQTGVAAGVGASIATAAISYSQTGTMLSVSPWEAIGIWYMGSATPEQQIALGFQIRQPQVPDHMNKFLAS